ncbi:MAG: GntR family transcriptional regulator [Comamonas sp.]
MAVANDEDSKTDAAYQLLRREILAARLPAEAALRPTALKASYGLSWTPVREALARLEAERLVVYRRNHGFTVAPVSSAELDDLQRARQAIELPLLKEAIENGDADWEAELVAAHHRLIRCTLPVDAPSEDTLAQWEHLHAAFHRALLSAAVSKWLLRFQAQIHEQLARHHRVLAILPVLTSQEEGAEEAREVLRDAMGTAHHTELFNAVLDRDVDRALLLMAEHIGATLEVFERTNAVQEKLARQRAPKPSAARPAAARKASPQAPKRPAARG